LILSKVNLEQIADEHYFCSKVGQYSEITCSRLKWVLISSSSDLKTFGNLVVTLPNKQIHMKNTAIQNQTIFNVLHILIYFSSSPVVWLFWCHKMAVHIQKCRYDNQNYFEYLNKMTQKVFYYFFAAFPLYDKANEEAFAVYYTVIKHSGHFRTLKKCRKHLPLARVFYISFVFPNACHVLSQCNTQLRPLCLLNMQHVHLHCVIISKVPVI